MARTVNAEMLQLWAVGDLPPKPPPSSWATPPSTSGRGHPADRRGGQAHPRVPALPCSPDLNPIERKWARAKAIRRRRRCSVEELFAAAVPGASETQGPRLDGQSEPVQPGGHGAVERPAGRFTRRVKVRPDGPCGPNGKAASRRFASVAKRCAGIPTPRHMRPQSSFSTIGQRPSPSWTTHFDR